MAYSVPAFMLSHQARDEGFSAFSARNANALSADDVRPWIDSRVGELGSFTATGADAGFLIDFTSRDQTRAFIPAGHNMGGETLELVAELLGFDGVAFFAVLDTITPVGSELLDFSWPSIGAIRYWGLQAQTSSAAEVYSFGEFWIGTRFELSGSDVQPGFASEWTHDVREETLGGREATIERSAPRRLFSLEVRYVVPGTDDASILASILENGRVNPFLYWPPDDTDPGPFVVKLRNSGTRVQEAVAPQASIAYSVTLEMIEQA